MLVVAEAVLVLGLLEQAALVVAVMVVLSLLDLMDLLILVAAVAVLETYRLQQE
jgi:uncharacterized membrane protein YqjE